MTYRTSRMLAIAFSVLLFSECLAQEELRIVHVHSATGPQEELGKQTQVGLLLGFDYATRGTGVVAGKKIVLIEKDDQGKPDVGKALLATAFADEKAQIAIGPTQSNVALALLPVAEEYKKVLIVEPAVADSITGERWNKYVFRTGRSSTQDAVASAIAMDGPEISIVTVAQDYVFGRDGVKALKGSLKQGKVVHEEYLPPTTTDFTATGQRIIEKLKDLPGKKIVWILWSGVGNPYKLNDLDLKKYGIQVSSIANVFSAMAPFKNIPGLEGSAYYYYGIPKNPINDWLVSQHERKFGSPPDMFVAGGFSAAMAIVEALTKTNGDASADALVPAMEGMSVDTPKGKMTFRKEDHQALQSMYHYRIKVDPALAWGTPELVREIKAEEIEVPVRNKR